jgi:hypothetical protein
MEKNLSKVIEQFVYNHLSHRDDIKVDATKTPKRYNVHVEIYLKPTDGLYNRINKGIDRQDLMNGLKGYLNLDWHNCMISYEIVESTDYDYSII